MEIFNHQVVNFDSEIRIPTEQNIIDNLWEQSVDFESFKLSSKHYKQLFFNYYTRNILNFLQKSPKSPIFIISKPTDTDFYEYIEQPLYLQSYQTNIDKLFKILPLISFIDTSKTFKELFEYHDSEWNELVTNQIIKQKDKVHNKSFKSIKNTIKYYDLEYLDRKIFENLKNRMIFV